MYGIASYQSGNHNRPPEDVSEKTKLSKDYHLDFAKYIYSMFAKDQTLTGYSDIERIRENRDYAMGRQSVLPYQQIFFGTQDDIASSEYDFIREALGNINWQPVSVAVKFVKHILNLYEDANPDMLFTALDETSTQKKLKKKAWIKGKIRNRQKLEQINQQTGMDLFGLQDEDMPKDEKELELYEQFGLIRLKEEEAYEVGTQEILDRCDEREIKRNLLFDFICAGYACRREYFNPYTAQLETRWVDVGDGVIISYNDKEYTNPHFAAELKEMTISELMAITDIPEEELKQLAIMYCGYYNNPAAYYSSDNYWTGRDGYGRPNWYNTTILVMDYEFISTNKKYFTDRKKNKYGNRKVYQEEYKMDEYGKERPPRIRNNENRDTRVYGVEMAYKGQWIVGSNNVFAYGYQNDIPRRHNNRCGSSFHFYKLPIDMPLIDIIKPNIDEMTLTVYNIQRLMAKAPGSGFFIDIDSITEMTIGEKTLDPFDIIKMGVKGGAFLYKGTTQTGAFGTMASQAKPLEYYPGGVGTHLQELMNYFEYHRRQIQELIGLPDVAVGGSQQQNTTLGEQQMRFSSSTNAIKDYLTGYLRLLKESCIHIILRMKLIAKYNSEGYKVMKKAMGESIARTFKLTASEALTDIGMDVMPILSPDRKELILQRAMQKGLPEIDMLKLTTYLESGRIRKAEVYFALRDKEFREFALQQQRENMMLNNQGQQQTNIMDESEKRKTKVLDSQLNKDEETHKEMLKRGTAQEQFIQNMSKDIMESGVGSAQAAQVPQ